ncbi:MAG: YcxB family protein, partial [Nitrospinaceae bacterium]|nr:YcxB family protein [Nitrospinaceae bacterium]NIU43692.1 YcxB family protein [Nitrospinaceae bacterium]
MREESEVGESRINWNGVTKIISAGDYTYIYIGAANAHVIPKYSIREGDYHTFVDKAQHWFQSKPLPSP